MIKPGKTAYWAKKKESENYRFRTYLKCNVDPKELDHQFSVLHEKYFSQYDCSRCRNCCKKYSASISVEEIKEGAVFLKMSEEEFRERYLSDSISDGKCSTKNVPCDFLQLDGSCVLSERKPLSCKTFPYTNQPGRMESLLGIIEMTGVCPVVYEIFEEIKRMYWK